jgi:hypothetical protein
MAARSIAMPVDEVGRAEDASEEEEEASALPSPTSPASTPRTPTRSPRSPRREGLRTWQIDSVTSDGSKGLIHDAENEELDRQLNSPSWMESPGYVITSVMKKAGEGFVVAERNAILQHARPSPSLMPAASVKLGGRGDVGLGVPIVRRGQRALAIAFTMPMAAGSAREAAHMCGGGDVYIGVADADAQAGFGVAEPGRAWGVRVRTGDVHVTPTASHAGYRGRSLLSSALTSDGFRAAMRAGPGSGVMPMHVTLLIDMTRRALAFSINGQAPIDAGIELPPAVRPDECMLSAC